MSNEKPSDTNETGTEYAVTSGNRTPSENGAIRELLWEGSYVEPTQIGKKITLLYTVTCTECSLCTVIKTIRITNTNTYHLSPLMLVTEVFCSGFQMRSISLQAFYI